MVSAEIETLYSEVLLTRPLMVLVKSGYNSKQVSIMRLIYIDKYILVLKQVVLIARVVLILSGLNRENLLKVYGLFLVTTHLYSFDHVSL